MSCWFWPAITDQRSDNDVQQPTLLTELLRTFGLAPPAFHTTPQKADNLASLSPLLQLPPELRDEIYRFALVNPNTTLPLLTTSQQLKMEAQPLLYQRPIKLSSQAKLFDWAARSRGSNLKQVKNLTLRLTDIDLSPLLDPDLIYEQPSISAWSLYDDEIGRFDTAFRALPGLTELTIIPPRIIHSQLMRSMYLTLLALIPQHYPRLRLLVIHDESAILDAVAALQGLPKVTFEAPAGSPGSAHAKASRSPRVRSQTGKSPRIKDEHGERKVVVDIDDLRTRLMGS